MLKGCTMFCICFSSLCLFFFFISSRWFIRHTSWTSCERLRNVICIHGKNSQARHNLPVEHIHVNRTNVLKLRKTKARGTWEKRKKNYLSAWTRQNFDHNFKWDQISHVWQGSVSKISTTLIRVQAGTSKASLSFSNPPF